MLSQQRKSRSLEHILDNCSSSSSYDQLTQGGGLTTLPRLRRCDQVPGMWRAEYNDSGHYSTDTMRSAKSVASIKSVQVTTVHHSSLVNLFYFRSATE